MSDTNDFEVVPLRAFKDKYIWTLRNDRYAAVVDPDDAQPVLDYLQQERLELCALLATHHHAEHVGSVAALLARHAVPVYGLHDLMQVPQLGLRFGVLDIPGRILPIMAQIPCSAAIPCSPAAAGACSRARRSKCSFRSPSWRPCPTRPSCTVVTNTPRPTSTSPGRSSRTELVARAASDAEKRRRERPTLLSTIGREKKTNPFLRCLQPAVIASANKYLGARASGPVQVFAAIRQCKNSF
jgi:hydroxyacylglutathione hydrolase